MQRAVDDRNAYMLVGRRAQRGYDWWWHSFLATDEATGALKPFFIEYFVINPALSPASVVLGQASENRRRGLRPSYALLKVGTWGTDKAQLHAFYPSAAFFASTSHLEVRLGEATLTEHALKGAVSVSAQEASDPARMTDAGELRWELTAEKVFPYSVGYGASPLARALGLFPMYWHVGGMLTRYAGTVTWQGQRYRVDPETSAGYQDKNWGVDFTSPWVWLNCNRFVDAKTRAPLPLTSLDVGGGRPIVAGLPLSQRLLIALRHEGQLFEWNFSKFWTGTHQRFDCRVLSDEVQWNIEAENRTHRLELHFSCPRSTMLKVAYENPDGERRHHALWNGGYAAGELILSERAGGAWAEVGRFHGELGGCEYGVEDRASSTE